MQPGKDFDDFFRAAAPFIGPLFAPQWRKLQAISRGNDLESVPEYLKALHRAACSPFSISVFAQEGFPFRGVAEAINAFTVGGSSPVRAVDHSPGSISKLITAFCKADRPTTFALFGPDLLLRPDEELFGLYGAIDRHWREETGVRLIIFVPPGGEEHTQWRDLRRDLKGLGLLKVLDVKVPPIKDRTSTILPWILKYLRRTGAVVPAFRESIPLGTFILIHITCGLEDETSLEREVRHLELEAQMGGATDRLAVFWDSCERHEEEPGSEENVEEVTRESGISVAEVKKRLKNLAKSNTALWLNQAAKALKLLDPQWLVDRETGNALSKKYLPKKPDDILRIGISTSQVITAYADYIRPDGTKRAIRKESPLPNQEPPADGFYFTEDCHHVNYDGSWFSPPPKARLILDFLVQSYFSDGILSQPDEFIAAEVDLPGQTSGGKAARVDDLLRKTQLWCTSDRPGAILGRDLDKRGHIRLFRKPLKFPPTRR